MGKKVWIEIYNTKRSFEYPNNESQSRFELGEIVGEQEVKRYRDKPAMAQMMSGDIFWIEKRYLVQIEDGSVHKIWQSDVFETDPKPSK